MIKIVGEELIGCGIVSDDLEPTHVLLSNAVPRRVHDELPTGRPLSYLALANILTEGASGVATVSPSVSHRPMNTLRRSSALGRRIRCGHSMPLTSVRDPS